MYYIKYFYDYRSPEVLQMIRKLLNRESTAIITLDYLMVIAEREEDKEVLRNIIRQRRENDERLKLIYYQYTGDLPEVDQITFVRPESFKEGIQAELVFQSERMDRLNELLNKVNQNYQNVVEEVINREQFIESRLRTLKDRS